MMRFPCQTKTKVMVALGGSIFLTTLNLAAGYWQIEVKPKDRRKLAFITPYGLFEFVRMLFGTFNSPATVQRTMQPGLHRLNWKECLAYLDDNIMLGKSFKHNVIHLEKYFSVSASLSRRNAVWSGRWNVLSELSATRCICGPKDSSVRSTVTWAKMQTRYWGVHWVWKLLQRAYT